MALTKVSKTMALVTPIIAADITNGNITTEKLAEASVTTSKIADGAVNGGKLAATLDLSMKTLTLPDVSVTAAKLANTLNLSTKTVTLPVSAIPNASVTNEKLVDLSVSTAKIAASSITTEKIQDAAIVAAKIASSSVTTEKIADSAVTSAKLTTDIKAKLATAYGQVSATGVVTGGLNVSSASLTGTNVFTVTLNAGILTANSIIMCQIAPVSGSGTTTAGAAVRCTGVTVASNQIQFSTNTLNAATPAVVAHPFHFIVI